MLVSTIKLYQQYYNIEQTGSLDKKTIGQMMVPRYGNRDIGNDSLFMQHSANHEQTARQLQDDNCTRLLQVASRDAVEFQGNMIVL
ncbi:hypothetical protein Ddye_031055 [Dipteronia dyeriana]|uniref:Uncharacterized protein n=1 Tax=Dipteronia dyeriana TaxID=168575 RepID=A0AAD9TIJ9_9ROSI|nr:hypothetical protein Ddye_031055 [Dipteronia dyeriana]